MQLLTVIVTKNLLVVAGIPVLVQATYIAIPSGQFYIHGGCSGFKYIVNNLMLFFLYSLMSRFNQRQFILGLLVAVSIALLMNWLRVVSVILFAHHFGIDYSFVQDHNNFGWVLYALFLLPFFYLMLQVDKNYHRKITVFKPIDKFVFAFPASVLFLLPMAIVFWHQWVPHS